MERRLGGIQKAKNQNEVEDKATTLGAEAGLTQCRASLDDIVNSTRAWATE